MPTIPRILLALANRTDCDLVSQSVTSQFPSAHQATTPINELLSTLASDSFQILLFDSELCEQLQLRDLLYEVTLNFPDLLTITIIPEHRQDSIQTAIESDVFFYLNSPIDTSELTLALRRAEAKFLHRLHIAKLSSSSVSARFPGFIGECPLMQDLFELISKIADDDFSTVLILGESGTGKELVAKAIHSSSRRKKNNFVPVNCAAIPDDLLESELFGHMKGSFTGATQSKQGRIQYADGGTLFLDEIGDMKPALQAKLLRVLQEKEFEPVGSLKATPVDTRVVAATHCDLEKLVKEGTFREDLYYRLSVIPLHVPPLRKRAADIPLLLHEFIEIYARRRGKEKIVFTPQSISVLMNYEWRGNVRELENLVQHMSILHGGKHIHPHELPDKYTQNVDIEAMSAPSPTNMENVMLLHDSSRERAELLASSTTQAPVVALDNGPINFNDLINEFEVELIIKAMKLTSGNKKEAARMLNLKRTTLLEKIKKKQLGGLWE